MKPKRLIITSMVILVALLIGTVAYAQGLLELPRWTLDGGGGSSTGGNYSLSGTIGQPDVGHAQGGSYIISGGFWAGGRDLEPYRTMLPITIKP